MKHNLILCTICSGLTLLIGVVHSIVKESMLTPGVILFVATMYFAGRYFDQGLDRD